MSYNITPNKMVVYNLTGGFGFSFEPTAHSWQYNLRYKLETDKGIVTGSIPILIHSEFGFDFNHTVFQAKMNEDLHAVLLTTHNEFIKRDETVLAIQSPDEKRIKECFNELCDKVGKGW